MDDTDDIEVEIVEPEDIETDEVSENANNGVGLIPVVIFSVSAALIGAFGGAYGAQFFAKTPDLSDVNSQFDRKLADVEDETKKALDELKTGVQGLKTDLMQVQGGQASEDVLAVLQDRVEALETMPLPEFREIDPNIVTALQNAQADGFEWPEILAIDAKLNTLENNYAVLADQLGSVSETVKNLDKQKQVSVQGSHSGVALTVTPNVTAFEFPDTALREAVETVVSKKGFFARTLSKHIDVRDPSDPIVLIEKARAAVEVKDLEGAIKIFDSLPDDIKAAGQDWRNAASEF